MNTRTTKPKIKRHRSIRLGDDVLDLITGDNAVEMFKANVRYIYQGLPTRPARYLLRGLRKPITSEIVKGTNGYKTTDRLPYLMAKMGLMMEVPLKVGRRSVTFSTSEPGLEVLRFWALRNAEFSKYLNAYCPFDVENRIKITRVDIAMGAIR